MESGRDDCLFLDQYPKYFFQLPNLNKLYCLGVEVAPPYHVIKRLKMNHLGLYTLHDLIHPMPQLLRSVIRKQRGHASY